jgi:hypothetical protein
MVRKDPLNERGPTPPSGRPIKKKGPNLPNILFELRPEVEYIRLWDYVIEHTSKNISLLKLYASLGMPKIPIEKLEDLREGIDMIIQREARLNE